MKYLTSILIFVLGVSSVESQITKKDILEDLKSLQHFIDTSHVAPYRLVTKKEFQRIVNSAERRIGKKEECDASCFMEYLKVIAALNDGHSVMASSSRNEIFGYLPITVKWFEDGLYVVRINEENASILGSKLVKVNGIDISLVLTKLRAVVPHGNDSRFKKYAYSYLRLPGLLYALGITTNSAQSTFSFLKNGVLSDVTFDNMPDEVYEKTTFVEYDSVKDSLPFSRQKPEDYYWFTYDSIHKAFYFQYNRIGNMKTERASVFASRMWEAVDTLEIDKFILDVRDNGGGQFAYALPFIQGILDRPKINARGKLFVISGYNTFSAALDLVRNLEVKSNAIIIGEPPGDYAASSGDAESFVLPQTKVKIQLSTVFHPTVFENDNRKEILLDKFIETHWKHYKANKDPLYDYVINYNETIPEIADSKGYGESIGRYNYDAEKDMVLTDINGKLHLEISQSMFSPLYILDEKNSMFATEVVGLKVEIMREALKLYFPDGTARKFKRKETKDKSALDYLYSGNFDKASAKYEAIKKENPQSLRIRDGRFSNHAIFAFYKLKSESRERASMIAKGILNLGITLNDGNAPQCKFALRFY